MPHNHLPTMALRPGRLSAWEAGRPAFCCLFAQKSHDLGERIPNLLAQPDSSQLAFITVVLQRPFGVVAFQAKQGHRLVSSQYRRSGSAIRQEDHRQRAVAANRLHADRLQPTSPASSARVLCWSFCAGSPREPGTPGAIGSFAGRSASS